jgi:hypothetical protein
MQILQLTTKFARLCSLENLCSTFVTDEVVLLTLAFQVIECQSPLTSVLYSGS